MSGRIDNRTRSAHMIGQHFSSVHNQSKFQQSLKKGSMYSIIVQNIKKKANSPFSAAVLPSATDHSLMEQSCDPVTPRYPSSIETLSGRSRRNTEYCSRYVQLGSETAHRELQFTTHNPSVWV